MDRNQVVGASIKETTSTRPAICDYCERHVFTSQFITNLLYLPSKSDHSEVVGPILSLPEELLREIFIHYAKLDCPIQILLQINKRWREVAIETQILWSHLVLSADPVSPVLHSRGAHICSTKRAVEQVLRRSGIAKLEITLLLGPHGPSPPTSKARSVLFRALHTDALSRIVDICITINSQMTRYRVAESLQGVFHDNLPALEKMSIASQDNIDLHTPLKGLLNATGQSSNLRNVYLGNVGHDFIIKASAYHFWTRLVCLMIRSETQVVDASIFGFMDRLKTLSFTGELVFSVNNLNKPVDFPHLQELRVGLISMGTLQNLRLPVLCIMVIHSVQGNFPNPEPEVHTLELKELKILHVTSANSSVGCIVARKLETLCLRIPTLKSSDADIVLNYIFDGDRLMLRPRHLTLTAPVHDKHLINALKFLPELMSLQLDHQIPFSKTFFQAMTPLVSLAKSREGRLRKTTKSVLCPQLRCLVVDVHRIAARLDLSEVGRDDPNMSAPVNQESSGNEGLDKNWVRESLLKIVETRKDMEHVDPLLRLACKWVANGQNEELVLPTMCLSCIEVKAAASE